MVNYDPIDHYCFLIQEAINEGGSKIKEPNAGITSDMSGRWRIKAFDTSVHGKKETPPMKEVVGINNAAIHEIGLFYQKASDELIRKFENLLNAGDEKGALSVVEKFHNVRFQGDLATGE